MSLQQILRNFDAMGPMAPRASITFDEAFTGSAALIAAFRAALDADAVTIDAVTDRTSRGDDHLRLEGTASLLGMTDAQVVLRAAEPDGELLVTLEVLVPSGWSFEELFPDLPWTMAGELDPESGDKAVQSHFLSRVALGTSRLVFASRACQDEALGGSLLAGLSFAGELYFMGVLWPLALLLDGPPPRLTGPLREYRTEPDPERFSGIRLTAPLTPDFTQLGPLRIDRSRIYLKSGWDRYHVDYVPAATQDPGIYFLFDAQLSGRPLELVGRYDDLDGSPELSVRGTFSDFALGGFGDLSQHVGVEGFDQSVPEDFPAPQGLALTQLGISVDTDTLGVTSLVLGLGMDTHWEIVPGALRLEEVGVTFVLSDPFGAGRRVLTSVSGLLAFPTFSLAAAAQLPGFRLTAGLPEGETLPLGDVVEAFVGGADVPALTVTRLRLSAEPQTKSFLVDVAMEDLLSIPVGPTAFEVAGFVLTAQREGTGASRGLVSAQLRMGEAVAVLSGEVSGALTLSGSLTDFDLKKFWSLVTDGGSLPDEVPDVVIESLGVTVTPSTGDFSLLGKATVAWDHLSKDGALSTELQFSFRRRSTGAESSTFAASITLQGTGPVEVAGGFTLRTFNLLFDYDTAAGWKLSGGINADLLDASLYLGAGYESTPAGQKVKLQAIASPQVTLVDLPGVGSYAFHQLDLAVDRRAVEGKETAETFFDLRVASTLRIDHALTVGGYLSIRNAADGTAALLFNPTEGADTHVPFPTGDDTGMDLRLYEIGFSRESEKAGWAFGGTAILGFTGFPDWLGKVLPSKVTTKLVVSSTTARLSALNVTDAVGVDLPKVDGRALGTLYMQVTELGISLRPGIGLALEVGMGFPAELNQFLGGQVFRVYQPGNYTTMARTRLTLAETGIVVDLVTSPFTGMNSVSIQGEEWFQVDLGDYGALALKMPSFVYDGVTQYFEAAGGVRVIRPLSVPLAPLKWFLSGVGLNAAADVFPDAIPVTEISLVDRNDDLKVDALIDFVRKAGDVPHEVAAVLREAGQLLNRFPDGFKHYLNIQAPTELEFRWGFSPSGRVSIGLLAQETPLRVLFPAVVPGIVPMPGLTGMELRKLTVGTISAGTLFFGEVDAVIDQFDLPSLALSLLLPDDPDFPLPASDQLVRRITLRNVFCVIPAAAGEPFPIPLFYDQIGFDYLGIEGIGIGAHVAFPRPELGGAQALALFQTFGDFVSDRHALLDPGTAPGGVDLAFTFRDEFLQAPEYLGGMVLGTRGKDVRVGTWRYVAEAMNFCKTFSLQRAIASIPIEHRVGSSEYRFAFLRFDADWLLTTPAEFRAGAWRQMKLTEDDVEDFVAVLPSVASSGAGSGGAKEEGLVAFVRGQADLGFLSLEAAFGLAASGSMGFATGFRFAGSIGPIEMEMDGAIMVNAPLADGSATAIAPASTVSPASRSSTLATGTARGKALSLNGRNAWVQVPASDSLMLPAYTVEMWLRPAQKQATQWVAVFGIDTRSPGEQRNLYLEINSKSGFYGHRFKDAKSGNSGAANTANGTVRAGEWQHLALTNDGATARTFIDGVEVASGAVNGGVTLLRDALYMGKAPGSANDRFYAGDLGEVRVWKRARTADEIQEEMHVVLDGDERDLVSCWRFDSDTGATAVDVCGRNHGTITNGAFVDSGRLALEGVTLNGTGDWIDVPDSQSLRMGAYTVEAWFRPRTMTENWAGVVGKKGRNHAVFIHRTGFVQHRFHDASGTNAGAPNTPAGTVAFGRWNHVAITNDGKTARTWVNGALLAEGAVKGGLVQHNEAIQIGRSADGAASNWFPGEIGEVRVWSRARSGDEVKGAMYRRLAGTEPDLVSLWRPAESAGDTLADACARNAGTFHVAGRVQPATLRHDGLVFDGRDDYALLPRSDRWKLPQYSVEAWIRPDADPPRTWQCVWGGNGRAPRLYINSSGAISHRFVSTGTVTTGKGGTLPGINVKVPVVAAPDPSGAKDRVKNTAAGQVRWGEWNHLAITSDGRTWRTFLNGAEVGCGDVEGEVLAEAVEVNVGRSHEGKADAFFAGSIDDVRVWSVARTAEQIRSDMNYPLTGGETGLVAYYDMDHTAGTRMADLGAGRVDGTVYGARWAMAAAPAEPERAALQIQGHTQLTVAGYRAMTGDLRVVDGDVWFRGVLDLFPRDWPVRVYGDVEGMLNGSRFYLSGDTDVALCGMTLAGARVYVSDAEMRLEGRFLGAYALLDVAWKGSDPHFRGTVGLSASPTLHFGAIRIAGVKVSDNVKLTLDLAFELAISIDRSGFGADVTARFKINEVGFSLSFHLGVAPGDLDDIVNWVKQRIIDAPPTYLAHLFSDAAAWLRNVAEGAIEFFADAGEAIGRVLNEGFNVAKEAVAGLMKDAGYAAGQVGAALSKAYGVAADAAAGFMKGAGYAAEEVGRFLKEFYQHPDAMAAMLLKGAGYAAEEVGKALASAYGAAAQAAANALKLAGFAAAEVGAALRDAFGQAVDDAARILKAMAYPVSEVGKALQSAYQASARAAADTLRKVGYAVELVGTVLKDVYKQAADAAAEILRGIGYSAHEAGKALQSAYRASAQAAANALKKVGYTASDVGGAMKSVYNQSADETAKVLKAAGYAASETGKALQSAYSCSAEAASKALGAAGYAAGEVSDCLQSVYGKSKKEVDKILKSAGGFFEGAGNTIAGIFS